MKEVRPGHVNQRRGIDCTQRENALLAPRLHCLCVLMSGFVCLSYRRAAAPFAARAELTANPGQLRQLEALPDGVLQLKKRAQVGAGRLFKKNKAPAQLKWT